MTAGIMASAVPVNTIASSAAASRELHGSQRYRIHMFRKRVIRTLLDRPIPVSLVRDRRRLFINQQLRAHNKFWPSCAGETAGGRCQEPLLLQTVADTLLITQNHAVTLIVMVLAKGSTFAPPLSVSSSSCTLNVKLV